MRAMIPAVAWPSLHDTQGCMLGLPFVLAAASPLLLRPLDACIAGLMVATLASFLIYVPLTALALNGGNAIGLDQPAPKLTARAYLALLGLWTATAWLAATLTIPT